MLVFLYRLQYHVDNCSPRDETWLDGHMTVVYSSVAPRMRTCAVHPIDHRS